MGHSLLTEHSCPIERQAAVVRVLLSCSSSRTCSKEDGNRCFCEGARQGLLHVSKGLTAAVSAAQSCAWRHGGWLILHSACSWGLLKTFSSDRTCMTKAC